MIDRGDHLAWCKARAIEYLDEGDLANAVASMGSDMAKHPETGVNNLVMQLGMMLVTKQDHTGVRRWIEGFI